MKTSLVAGTGWGKGAGMNDGEQEIFRAVKLFCRIIIMMDA